MNFKFLKVGLILGIGLLGVFGLTSQNSVLADSAPATPPYPSIQLNVKVGLGNLANKYVIIEKTDRYGTYYSLAEDYVSPNGYGANTYFALDKNYLTSSGGIDNLFTTTGSNEDTTMSPKDSESFNAHTYNFVIAKNDSLLDSEFGGSEYEAADNQYIKFPFSSDFYTRQGPDDPDCKTGYSGGTKDCIKGESTVTYVPQKISGNNMILVNAATLDQSQNLPWWIRIWNFIKSLF